jgi:hypothetical protein
MQADSIYKYIGIFVIALFFLFIVVRTLNFQAKVLEGLTTGSGLGATDKSNIPAAINSNTTILEDSLLLSKYKKNYEDIIINLENNINFNILNGIVSNSEILSKNPMDPAALQTIASLNSLKTFKDTLNDSMVFLNKTN